MKIRLLRDQLFPCTDLTRQVPFISHRLSNAHMQDISNFTGELVFPPPFYRQWMLAGNRALFFDRLIDDFGDFIHYRGLFNFYLINHPALVKQVLMETHKTFDKNTIIYRRFANVFGQGLVMAEGQHWRRQRKLMQPMFSPKAVQHFFSPMLSATEEMVERWKEVYQNSQVFDISNEMNRLTLEIAGQVLFSDGFDGSFERIDQWAEAINYYSGKPPLPIVRSFWFPSPLNHRLKLAMKEFHAFINELIDSRKDSDSHRDLLSILLSARHEDTGQAMSREEIVDEVLGMIIGGHETSASALTWLWYELEKNPLVQEKLRSEIDSVLQGKPLSIDRIEDLKYTRMVIDETLRLHPPFWFENRNVISDTELGGVILPKGSLVALSRYSLHRHSEFWREPDSFKPERHDPENPENSRSSHAFIPFSGGPRVCIGINFAIMELLVIVATIVQMFEVKLAECDRHQMAADLTMAPKYGVKVKLGRR